MSKVFLVVSEGVKDPHTGLTILRAGDILTKTRLRYVRNVYDIKTIKMTACIGYDALGEVRPDLKEITKHIPPSPTDYDLEPLVNKHHN